MKITSTRNDHLAKFQALARNRSTNVIHMIGGGASWCGASKRNSLVSHADATKANATIFCERCFPEGKPEAFFEVEVTQ
jgi:hypothetical protein